MKWSGKKQVWPYLWYLVLGGREIHGDISFNNLSEYYLANMSTVERDGWTVKFVDPDHNFAAVGSTAHVFDNLLEAKRYADANQYCVINEAIRRGKFIVRAVRDDCSNIDGVGVKPFPNGPWRIHRRWCSPPETTGWTTLPQEYGVIDGLTLNSFDNLSDAQAYALAHNCYLINEAFERFPPKFCVKKSPGFRLGPGINGPWRVHVGPLRIVIGLGCSESTIQQERIRTCVEVMVREKISNFLFVGSIREFQRFYQSFGMFSQNLPIDHMQSVQVNYDSQSETTLGNARFAMEKIKKR